MRRKKTGFKHIKPYKGTSRILLHILFWGLFYLFLLIYFQGNVSYEEHIPKEMSDHLFLFCGILLTLTIYIHYGAAYLLRKQPWLIIIYVFSAYCLNWLLFTLLFQLPDMIAYMGSKENLYYSPQLFSVKNLFFFMNVNVYINLLSITLKLMIDYHFASQKTLLLMELQNKMEVDFLKTQIKPHFLFNALNSIYGIALNDREAVTLLLDFSKLLRYLLYEDRQQTTLFEEIAIIRIFVQLHPDTHITFHYGHFNDTIIRKYELLNGVQNIYNAPVAHIYELVQEDNTFHFKPVAP